MRHGWMVLLVLLAGMVAGCSDGPTPEPTPDQAVAMRTAQARQVVPPSRTPTCTATAEPTYDGPAGLAETIGAMIETLTPVSIDDFYATGTQWAKPTRTATQTTGPDPATATRAPTATEGSPEPFEWERTIPCMEGAEEVISAEELMALRQRLYFWKGWIERYADEPRIPTVIGLAVIAEESRGLPGARGCAGEVGLFQIIPKDPRMQWAPEGCARQAPPDIPENPSYSQASNSMYNIRWGMNHVRDMAWFAESIARGLPFDKVGPGYEAWLKAAEFADLEWWGWSDIQPNPSLLPFWALAMHQCGSEGFWLGAHCGKLGGLFYAKEVLSCWVPWIKTNVIENPPEGITP